MQLFSFPARGVAIDLIVAEIRQRRICASFILLKDGEWAQFSFPAFKILENLMHPSWNSLNCVF